MHDRLVSRRIDALHQCFLVVNMPTSFVIVRHLFFRFLTKPIRDCGPPKVTSLTISSQSL